MGRFALSMVTFGNNIHPFPDVLREDDRECTEALRLRIADDGDRDDDTGLSGNGGRRVSGDI